MATLDDVAKSNQEAVKLLGEVVKLLAKAGGDPGSAPRFAGKQGTAWHMFQQLQGGRSLGMQGLMRGQMGGGFGAAGGAGGGLSKMGGLGAIAQVAVELAKLPGRIKEFAEQLHSANRAFAQFSPAMAQVMAVSDWRDMMRGMNQGNQLAGSASSLANSRGSLLDQMAPMETSFQKLQNSLGAFSAGGMANFLEKSQWGQQIATRLDEIAEVVEDVGEWLGFSKKEEMSDTWINELEFLAQAEDMKRAGRTMPVRMPPIKNMQGALGQMAEQMHERARKAGGF